MSLYADLDQNGKKDKERNIDGWGSNMKMLETQKKLHQSRQLGFNKIKKPSGASVAPVHDLSKQYDDDLQMPYSFNSSTGRMEQETVSMKTQDEIDELAENSPDKVAIGGDDWGGRGSDDRSGSGDYRNRESDGGRGGDSYRDKGRMYNDNSNDRDNSRGGATIAPPSFLQVSDPPSKKPVNIASKIMAKMGYKHGSGLGKEEQGISKPLVVEKTSKNSCKIVQEAKKSQMSPDIMAGIPLDFMMPPPPGSSSEGPGTFATPMAPPPHQQQSSTGGVNSAPDIDQSASNTSSNAALMSNPTRVILLRNMVSPGEVDAELEEETASECSKYGKVVKCTISENFEMNNEDGVRVFLQFEKVDSAIRAVMDLNGRFFGGRAVRATFYDINDFRDMKFNNQA